MSKPLSVAQGFLELESGSLIELDSSQWQEWLSQNSSFRYVPTSNNSCFTVRKEKSKRGDSDYWYGYRKVEGKLHKKYVAKTADLTLARLEEVAGQLDQPATPRPKRVTDKTVEQLETAQLYKQIAELHKEVTELQSQVTQLQQEKTELHNRLHNVQPDYEAKRDRILAGWRVQKRAETKERIREALDRFIGLLVEPLPVLEVTVPQVKTKATWESKVTSFLSEASWHE